jgi:hypothetical protein
VDLHKELPIYIVPSPDKEDLRGPARPTRPAPSGPAGEQVETQVNEVPAVGAPLEQAPAGGQQPAEPAAEEAPDPLDNLDLPGFGPPQGLLQPLPQTEDGLPALPSTLSQAITMGTGPAVETSFPTRAQAAMVIPAPTARANSSVPVPRASVARPQYVTPAAANIELSNPAAKNVQKTMDQDLQQAIYYEASDSDSLK